MHLESSFSYPEFLAVPSSDVSRITWAYESKHNKLTRLSWRATDTTGLFLYQVLEVHDEPAQPESSMHQHLREKNSIVIQRMEA